MTATQTDYETMQQMIADAYAMVRQLPADIQLEFAQRLEFDLQDDQAAANEQTADGEVEYF